MAKLVIVGHLAVNRVLTDFGQSEYFGGAGYHVAWSAAQFLSKGDVALVSFCGRDFDLSGLKKAGVDLRRVRVDKSNDSDIFSMHETSFGRKFNSQGDLAAKVSIDRLCLPSLRESRMVHLATAPPDQQIGWFKEIKEFVQRGSGLKISVDSFELFTRNFPEKVVKVFNSSDLIFANQDEWRLVGRRVRNDIPVLLKLGEKGATYLSGGKRMYNTPAPKVVKVVDTTGAGEVFAGVFLALSLRGFSDQEAIRVAVKSASWSIEDYGIEHLLKKEAFVNLVNS